MSEETKVVPPVEDEAEETLDKFESTIASRARNRTVMLTPDVAGQVRSLITGEGDAGTAAARRDALNELLPPAHPDFERPRGPPSGRASGPRGGGIPESSSPWKNVTEPLPQPGRPQFGPSGPMHSVSTNFPLPSREMRSADLRTSHGGVASEQPMSAPAPRKRAVKSKIVGFLISYDKDQFGEIFELRTGRWLITSRPIEHGEYLLMEDDSISPLHGILRVTDDGKIQILDQLSEFGTGVTPAGATTENEVAGAMTNIHHGDLVRFGKRRFVTCLVPDRSV